MVIEIYREQNIIGGGRGGLRWRMWNQDRLVIARSGRVHDDDLGLAADMSAALRGQLYVNQDRSMYFIGNDGVRIEVTVDER